MPLKRGLKIALVPLALDRHPQNVRRAPQKCEIMLDELAFGSAADLEHAEGPAISLQDDVHGAANAMSDENLGGSKALLDFEMIGDDGPAGFQRKPGRRSEIGADGGDADNARLPTDSGANQKLVFSRNIFEHAAKLSAKALRGQARRFRQKLVERRSLQCAGAELSQDFLLPNTLLQGA